MDAASLASDWTAVLITSVGLLGLIAQAGSIRSSIDPFREARTQRHLGPWIFIQPHSPWFRIAPVTPLGPALYGDRDEGFCGTNVVLISRKAAVGYGRASWSILLACFHNVSGGLPERLLPEMSSPLTNEKNIVVSPITERGMGELSWSDVPLTEMIKHDGDAFIPITRKVLILCFVMGSARQIWRYAGSSGYRAAFSSYNGLYNVDSPLGGKAVVTFSTHDSHKHGRDTHPRFFRRRVDKGIDMLAGVVVREGSDFMVAFPGREEPGSWLLQWEEFGYAAHYGSRNLYSMMGGQDDKCHKFVQRKIDPNSDNISQLTKQWSSSSTQPSLLSPASSSDRTTVHSIPSYEKASSEVTDLIAFSLPSLTPDEHVRLHVPPAEFELLAESLDSLPWSPLPWAMHRGMQDILLAYGMRIMNHYRTALAEVVRENVITFGDMLETRGWQARYVKGSMGANVYSAIMAGRGGSGDAVRAVTDVVRMIYGLGNGSDENEMDQTDFWRQHVELGRWLMGKLDRSKNSPKSASDASSPTLSTGSAQGSPIYTRTVSDNEVIERKYPSTVSLTQDAIVALTKYFVLEWSHDFDYRVYHDFPVEMLMR